MNRLRGNHPATIDVKGRLKIPTAFRRHIEEHFGRELYVTSVTGTNVLIYPLSVWEELEHRVYDRARSRPAGMKFLQRTSFFGQEGEMDGQGRILIPQHLRQYAHIEGEVAVLGHYDHLEVWSLETLKSQLEQEPFTLEDFQNLADLGI